jgi:hypothetical protein
MILYVSIDVLVAMMVFWASSELALERAPMRLQVSGL